MANQLLTDGQNADQLASQLTHENRLRLANAIAWILFIFGTCYVLAFNLLLVFVPDARQPIFLIVDAIIITAVSGWFSTLIFVRRGNVNTVAALIVVSFFLAISALLISFSAINLLQPLLLTGIAAYMLVIILAGLLGTRGLVIITTLCCDGASLAFLIYQMEIGRISFTNQFALLGPQIVIQQWAAAIFILVLTRFSQNTLHQLSDTLLAIDQARKLDDLKNQFISSVNHELRNPIMTLQGLIEVIYQGLRHKIDPAMLVDLAHRADRVGDGLRQLVLSILEVRSIEQDIQQLTPSMVEVSHVVTEAANLIAPDERVAVERELRLRLAPHVMVWADPIRLQQVLVNLLSNAVKYSEPGTPIEISAIPLPPSPLPTSQRSGKLWVELRVRDYGFGIPPAEIPLLFHRFVRLPRDLASHIIGNGLGLFLCKEYVEAMGGRIWVESSGVPGEGSTFVIHLPASAPPSAPSRPLDRHERQAMYAMQSER